MWWLVNIEVPQIGEALIYMGDEGVHQFYLLDGSPVSDRIEAYTTLRTAVEKPDWWASDAPPAKVAFWEKDDTRVADGLVRRDALPTFVKKG